MSSVILFKIGYRDTTVSGSLGPLPMAYVIAFEWALGFYLLAAITITLANTQPLINRPGHWGILTSSPGGGVFLYRGYSFKMAASP